MMNCVISGIFLLNRGLALAQPEHGSGGVMLPLVGSYCLTTVSR